MELIFQIIEHAYADQATLGSCALICRACLPIARAILYEHVTVKLSSQDVSTGTFVHTFIATSVNHIRCLTLESKPYLITKRPTLKLKDLVSITSMIPNLRKLKLRDLSLDFNDIISSNSQDMPLTQQNSVKTVELRFLTICSPRGNHQPTIFEYLFASFPAIQHIIYRSIINFQLPIRITSTDVVAGPSRSLSCHNVFRFRTFFENIRPFLNSFEIIDYTPYLGSPDTDLSDFDELHVLCASVTPKRLKVLRFCIAPPMEICLDFKRLKLNNSDAPSPDHPEGLWRDMGWRDYTVLHTIYIVIGMPTVLFIMHIYILPFLPTSIRTIVFELAWGERGKIEPSLKWLDAPYVEKCVEGLPNLEEVVFMPHYLGHTLTQSTQNSIRTQLANLDARGLLRIASVCESVDWWQYERPGRAYSRLGTRLI
ncbi:hypothetical protein QCA50_020680 [Cerrena zonata]|uniref:F-box domain-containing protein n=1 Tax=Cerrena zonata TaxID=2478898 RepID=A0AAW0F8U0_9APHY